jgi:hypothetical protein
MMRWLAVAMMKQERFLIEQTLPLHNAGTVFTFIPNNSPKKDTCQQQGTFPRHTGREAVCLIAESWQPTILDTIDLTKFLAQVVHVWLVAQRLTGSPFNQFRR